jgi:hypothetical protein
VQDTRTKAEKYLDEMEIQRENMELLLMNGTSCGLRQAKILSVYKRPQQRHDGKWNR